MNPYNRALAKWAEIDGQAELAEALGIGPAQQVLAALVDDRLGALYVLALTSGLRIGECLAVRWEDLDLKHGRFSVRRKVVHFGRTRQEGPPKSDAGYRRIELSALAVDALERHRGRQVDERLRCGPYWQAGDLVFTTAGRLPLRATTVTGHFVPQLLERAGSPGMVFHNLRQSLAGLMLSDWDDLAVVSRMLGHSDPAMTLRIYRHLFQDEPRGAVDRLTRQLQEQGEPD